MIGGKISMLCNWYSYTPVYFISKIPIEIQWVGRAPWFGKYKTGAWPQSGVPTVTKSMVPNLFKHGFSYKIKANSHFYNTVNFLIQGKKQNHLKIIESATNKHPLIL